MKHRRSHIMKVRFTPEELAQVQVRAGGMPVASWLRGVALQAPAPKQLLRQRVFPKVSPIQAELVRTVVLAGNYLRDFADHVSAGNVAADRADLIEISRLLREALASQQPPRAGKK